MSDESWSKRYEACRVRIGTPEKVIGGGLSKNFMVYPLVREVARDDGDLFSKGATVVQRRFSEFEDVRALLVAKFGGENGMIVPSLPPKAGWGTGDAVVARRVRGLGLFCAGVVSNPFLGSDADWLAFCTGTMAYNSVAQSKWNETVAAFPNNDLDPFSVRARLDILDGGLDGTRRSTETLARSLTKAARDAQDLHFSLALWANHEELAAARDAFDALATRSLTPLPEAARAWIVDVCDYQLRQSKILRDMLAKLDDLETQARQARDKLRRLEFDPPDDVVAKLADRNRRGERLRKALHGFTIPHFFEARARAVADLNAHCLTLARLLGAVNLDKGDHSSDLGLAPAAQSALHVLDALDIPRPEALFILAAADRKIGHVSDTTKSTATGARVSPASPVFSDDGLPPPSRPPPDVPRASPREEDNQL